jgi:hypothetical protein
LALGVHFTIVKFEYVIHGMAFRDGQRYDVVIMDILKTEFLEKYGIVPKK